MNDRFRRSLNDGVFGDFLLKWRRVLISPIGRQRPFGAPRKGKKDEKARGKCRTSSFGKCLTRLASICKEGKNMHWYIGVLRKYTNFSGRSRRKEYWMFFLINSIVSLTISYGFGLVHSLFDIPETITGIPYLLYVLFVITPSIALGIRRMHDTGRRGWWFLFPFVNIVLALLDSNPGDNRYGPNPKTA
jgi:uncharacterized membrane protein YhaH (DUF805 family)